MQENIVPSVNQPQSVVHVVGAYEASVRSARGPINTPVVRGHVNTRFGSLMHIITYLMKLRYRVFQLVFVTSGLMDTLHQTPFGYDIPTN